MKLNVLLIGSGGREHALAWKISQSLMCGEFYCAPSNVGIKNIAKSAKINVKNHQEVIDFCKNQKIDFVIVGPEDPLAQGIVDDLESSGILTFGPLKAAAMLESSKDFSKQICVQNNIPTAKYKTFNNPFRAKEYIKKQGAPIVIKADGLAAGKGVVVAQTIKQALDAVENIMENKAFGESGALIVVEECLFGEELSYFAIFDGKGGILPIGTAQDHKRIGDGDTGPNTGGMGTYSPANKENPYLMDFVLNKVCKPLDAAMRSRGTPFKGVLFVGLMVNGDDINVIEFNVRFGDPETQSIMLRLNSDLLELFYLAAKGQLDKVKSVDLSDDFACCVVMASKGYPLEYQKGTEIEDLSKAEAVDGVKVFHAGTDINEKGELVAVGGRVLGIAAIGSDFIQARARAYEAVSKVVWSNAYYRNDIGKALNGAPNRN